MVIRTVSHLNVWSNVKLYFRYVNHLISMEKSWTFVCESLFKSAMSLFQNLLLSSNDLENLLSSPEDETLLNVRRTVRTFRRTHFNRQTNKDHSCLVFQLWPVTSPVLWPVVVVIISSCEDIHTFTHTSHWSGFWQSHFLFYVCLLNVQPCARVRACFAHLTFRLESKINFNYQGPL